jgi:phosphoglycolate phosphatase
MPRLLHVSSDPALTARGVVGLGPFGASPDYARAVALTLLVLFDVDGTLFLTDDPLLGRSVIETLEEIYDVALPEDAISNVDHAGQTSKRIARLVLSGAGLDDRSIDAHLDAWCACSAERYTELLALSSTARWRARPGSAKALTVLTDRAMRLALLTGNPEPVARARMERLGLARFFPEGQGAFGCEGETRAELLALARGRADGSEAWPNRTIEVGDTCRDIESAHAAGIRSVAIASGRVERKRLEAADALIDTMPELIEVLLRWE